MDMIIKNKRVLAGILVLGLTTGAYYQSTYAIKYDIAINRVVTCMVFFIGVRGLLKTIKSDYSDESQNTLYKGIMISGTVLALVMMACFVKKNIESLDAC